MLKKIAIGQAVKHQSAVMWMAMATNRHCNSQEMQQMYVSITYSITVH